MPERASSTVSLADLIALNDEIAALVRAGAPLDRGLAELARDVPGRLATIAADLARRLAGGESLGHALRNEGHRFPPLYAAVVEAGIRSGRLTLALEGMAASARRLAEMRAVAGVALLYPLVVLFVAWLLFVLFVVAMAPTVAPAYENFEAPSAGWITAISQWSESVAWWAPTLPLVVILAVAGWWRRSKQSLLLGPRWAGRMLIWVPGARKLLAWSSLATFADVLSLLVSQQLPMDEALLLAAEASGSPRLLESARTISVGLRQGILPAECLKKAHGIPPLLSWLIVYGHERGTLAAALANAAQRYRQRAIERATATRVLLPIALTLGIGGSATLAIALLLFLPWISLMEVVSRPLY